MKMILSFGKKLRLLREERELNQTELDKAVNMTQRKVSCLEQDKYEPSMEDIRALCTFLKYICRLFSGLPKMSALSTKEEMITAITDSRFVGSPFCTKQLNIM